MNITLIIIAVILFVAVYFNKRRYGLLGFALIAGSIVSASWSGFATSLLQDQGVKLLSPPLNVVVAVILVLLPAIFLLFVGPKYKKKWQRIIGSLLFTGLGILLIITAIAREAPQLIDNAQLVSTVTQAYSLTIVVGVVLAVIDTIMAHAKKNKKSLD